jgi:hypothetical protein
MLSRSWQTAVLLYQKEFFTIFIAKAFWNSRHSREFSNYNNKTARPPVIQRGLVVSQYAVVFRLLLTWPPVLVLTFFVPTAPPHCHSILPCFPKDVQCSFNAVLAGKQCPGIYRGCLLDGWPPPIPCENGRVMRPFFKPPWRLLPSL